VQSQASETALPLRQGFMTAQALAQKSVVCMGSAFGSQFDYTAGSHKILAKDWSLTFPWKIQFYDKKGVLTNVVKLRQKTGVLTG
jgi:hypothetical protein